MDATIAGAATWIAADDPWPLWTVICVGVAVSIHLEQNHAWAAKLSGPVIALLLAMGLSSAGVMPTESPTYGHVQSHLAPVAIPLLLFKANLKQILRETGWMFVAVHLATLGTVLGALAAGWLFQGWLPRVAELAGVMTASYVGGGINFMAVTQSYQVEGNLTVPLLVADNIVMAAMFIAMLMTATSRFFLNRYSHPHIRDAAARGDDAKQSELNERHETSQLDIAKALAVAVSIAALAAMLSRLVSATITHPMWQPLFGNMFVLTTTLSVIAATLFPRALQSISGAQPIGGYLLYMFLFVLGLPANVVAVSREVPVMLAFCFVIAVPNLVVTLLLGKWLRIPLEELLLASNATLGGPPTAAAMAVSKGWPSLALPALLIGLWGYTIGTVVGICVTESLRRML